MLNTTFLPISRNIEGATAPLSTPTFYNPVMHLNFLAYSAPVGRILKFFAVNLLSLKQDWAFFLEHKRLNSIFILRGCILQIFMELNGLVTTGLCAPGLGNL